VENNVFSTVSPYYPASGFFGPGYTSSPPVFGSSGNIWSGNTWYDGPNAGLAITAP